MRPALPRDVPAITACLAARPEKAMFPLSNLRRFGLNGDAPYAPVMWIAGDGGDVTDVLAQLRNGSVMGYLPSGDIEAATAVLAGRSVGGFIGPAEVSRPLMARLGLAGRDASIDRDEPHFVLELPALVVPAGPGRLASLQQSDAAEMIDWRMAYDIEVLGAAPDKARANAPAEYRGAITAGSHRVLIDGQTPLAVTGFNARLPQIVQVGGVYTPPPLRGRGHARRAVALHLAEVRDAGVRRATLFASGPAAVRAYEAIGFRPIGAFTLCLFRAPAVADG